MPRENVLGWDIGGAHVKVAKAAGSRSISHVYQLPCQLWRGLNQLRASIDVISKQLDFSESLFAITMTGEMVDHFNSRKEGTRRIIGEIEENFSETETRYFAGAKGFVSAGEAVREYRHIASANWFGSANFIATQLKDALFIDVGSTTTDILAIQGHQVMNEGCTDAERLYAQELVYCGVVRTPVFALCKAAPIEDRFIPVVNEYFASSADLYRLTGELPGYADMGNTPDGRGRDKMSSAVRLARIFGYDAVPEELSLWRDVAEYVRERQIQTIINACRKHLSKVEQSLNFPVVGAGVGRFLVKEIAQRLNRRYVDVASLFDYEDIDDGVNVGDCASAASIACLGFQRYCI